MSHDYHLVLNTNITPEQVRHHLRADLGLTPTEHDNLLDPAVLIAVRAADRRSIHLTDPGLAAATVVVTFMPRPREAGPDAAEMRTHQLAAALMRFCPGDAAFAFQEATTSLLRHGDTVYRDPDQAAARLLPEEAFAPAKTVAGMPAKSLS